MNVPHKRLRLALGQLNLLVGDVAGNAQKIVAAAERACRDLETDLLVRQAIARTLFGDAEMQRAVASSDLVRAFTDKPLNLVSQYSVQVGGIERTMLG